MSVDLDALAALVAKATPGPWAVSPDDAKDTHVHADSGLARVDSKAPPVRRFKSGAPVPHWPVARLCEWPEAALIVAAVNALPALIARVRAQEAALVAADAMRRAGVAIAQCAVHPEGCTEKQALSDFIEVFDGPLQRAYDAARGYRG